MKEYHDFIENDLADILASDIFDQNMEFRPEGGEAISFRGFYSAPSEESLAGAASNAIAAQSHTVAYQETALPRPLKRGDRLMARGQLWEVYKYYSDGQGLATVWLHLVN